eukprot:8380743-Alexandrium_andersonii.AAC.1
MGPRNARPAHETPGSTAMHDHRAMRETLRPRGQASAKANAHPSTHTSTRHPAQDTTRTTKHTRTHTHARKRTHPHRHPRPAPAHEHPCRIPPTAGPPRATQPEKRPTRSEASQAGPAEMGRGVTCLQSPGRVR